MGKIIQPEKLKWKYVNLREVEISDAAFILALRTDEKKSRFLHKTENNLQKQIDYLKRYKALDNEWYFIIENKKGKPLGTVRIYNVNPPNFTGGSWLMTNDALPEETIEGDLILKEYAFEVLGFEKSCFEVRKGNKKVIRYHQMCGAKIVGENEIEYLFELTKQDYEDIKEKLNSMLQ